MKQQQHNELLITLPQESQFEILVRLSVKSLLLCKCVCKTLQNLIQNPSFVQSHLTRLTSSSYDSQSLILQFTKKHDSHYLLSANTRTKDTISTLPLTPPIPVLDKFGRVFIVGSCNGLILFRVMCGSCKYNCPHYLLILWNPVLRQSRYLPKPHCACGIYEFGFIPETNDYVVVTFGFKQKVIMVDKMSIDSWITIDCSSYAEAEYFRKIDRNEKPVFLNGSFHWVVYGVNDILYYNLKDEKVGLIKGLDDDRALDEDSFPRDIVIVKELTVVDESLAMIYWNSEADYLYEIWVMKDYNVGDSWALRFRIDENFLDYGKLNHPLGYWTNDLMIVDERVYANMMNRLSTFVLYDVTTGSRLKIPGVERDWEITSFCCFMETLVPVR